MARKKNTETPVTEEVKTQDPTVTSETPVISNEESEKQEQDTVETPDTSSIKESSQKPEKKDKTKEKDEIPEFVKELLQKETINKEESTMEVVEGGDYSNNDDFFSELNSMLGRNL